MFLQGILISLVAEHLQGRDKAGASIPRIDHVIQIPSGRSDEGVGELFPVFHYPLLRSGLRILRSGDLPSEEDLHSSMLPGRYLSNIGLKYQYLYQ